MKSLFVRNYAYVCDENSNGRPSNPRLPCTIFLAAAFCDRKGHDVDVISVVDPSDFKPDAYDVVAVWVPLFEGFDLHLDYLRQAKAQNKRTIMVLNEPLESLEMEVMSRYEFIDITIRANEREFVLEQVLSQLSRDITTQEFDFQGVMFRDSGNQVRDNGKLPFFKSLDHLPSSAKYLAREAKNFHLYEHAFVEIARGCPYLCDFCFYNRTSHRRRQITDIVDELKVIEGHFRHVWFHDLNMLVHKEYTSALCHKILAEGLKIPWGTDGRMELCTDVELLKLMGAAGCNTIALGVESADETILKNIHKEKNLKYFDIAVQNCRAAGIRPILNLMMGFPWENRESLEKAMALTRRYDIAYTQFVRPLRGTPLYDTYKKLGLITRDLGLDDYNSCRDEPMFPSLYLTKADLEIWRQRLSFRSMMKGWALAGFLREKSLSYLLVDFPGKLLGAATREIRYRFRGAEIQ